MPSLPTVGLGGMTSTTTELLSEPIVYQMQQATHQCTNFTLHSQMSLRQETGQATRGALTSGYKSCAGSHLPHPQGP